MGSRGARIAGLLGLWSVFLVVFYCGGSFYGFVVYRELVLLYDINLALMSARDMLALTSATPGMPYAVHVRALGMSTSGRSRSRVTPAVGSVRTQVALTVRIPTPPMPSTAAPRMPCHPRRPACTRDFFFLMQTASQESCLPQNVSTTNLLLTSPPNANAEKAHRKLTCKLSTDITCESDIAKISRTTPLPPRSGRYSQPLGDTRPDLYRRCLHLHLRRLLLNPALRCMFLRLHNHRLL
jgi:hypothetical protein